MEKLEVIASFSWLEKEETIGTLSYEKLRGSDVFSFEYSRQWIKDHADILLGKDLPPFTGIQFAHPGQGIFGCFADALPDSWGRRLIDLRTNQIQKNNHQPFRPLSDWDYLKEVEDTLRVGAFRFRKPDSDSFLNTSDKNQIPPILSLNELQEAASEVERSDFQQSSIDERLMERLFKPGSSVGGARPKACVSDGANLYIAKFPSLLDGRINVGRWEYFAHEMAKVCGIHTAVTRLVTTDTGHDILLSKRFDRTTDMKRVHMASALTLLGLPRGSGADTGHGYPDIADFIVSNGTNVEKSLEELYRRVAFNICIGNSDDHLKNHSFLLTKKGWELSPVYDINPSNFRSHSLLIDGTTNESSLDILFKAHKLYFLDEDIAYGIIEEVRNSMKHWKSVAADCGLNPEEIKVFSDRFEVGMQMSTPYYIYKAEN